MKLRLTNPIVTSEMKVLMRTWRTPITLLAYLATMLFFLMSFSSLMSIGSGRSSEMGLLIYSTLVNVQFFVILLIGPSLTAGAISSEREKQTLDLLICTQMSPLKIVTGKLISSMSWMLLLVISTIPFYSIAFLYGGVSPFAVALSMLYLMLCAFATGAIGLFFSTVFKKTVTSSVMSYVVIFGLGVGTLILGALEMSATRGYYFSPRAGALRAPIAFYFNPYLGFTAVNGLLVGGNARSTIAGIFSGVRPWEGILFILINVAFMLVVSVFMLFIAVRRLDPMRAKGRRRAGRANSGGEPR